MTFEQWLEQLITECTAIGARPPLTVFQRAYFNTGMTPAETAQFLKEKQS